MEQKITNGDFREISIDWGSPEGDRTVHKPYIISSTHAMPIVYLKPKLCFRLFGKIRKTRLNGLIYKSLVKDEVIYLWTNKKYKHMKYASIVSNLINISDKNLLIMIEGENNGTK